ncbi:MAG: hypothetical protein AMXMBFR13_29220 [Phycisphaerae bacterium]
MKLKLKLVACKVVPVSLGAGPRVMIMPWGLSIRDDGIKLLVDDQAGRAIKNSFDRLGRDVVIDYEHQSLGGQWSSPNGKAPAAGWMKAGTMEVVPGKGVFCAVEWTPQAARQIQNKEYRFLSAATYYDAATGRVFEIPCAGLTNDPALRMPALVNSKNAFMQKEINVESTLAGWLDELLTMSEEASSWDLVTKMKEISNGIIEASVGATDGAAMIGALADLALKRLKSETQGFTGPSSPRSGAGRQEIILNARSEYVANSRRDRAFRRACSEGAWVSQKLSDAGYARLTEAELDAHAIRKDV